VRDEIEAVGDADAVKSTAAGMHNIRREMGLLLATADRPGENTDDLSELYGALIAQWGMELGHVAHVVGGEEVLQKHGGQPGPRFTPVSRERQRAAVAFLATNAFATPTFLFDSSIVRRIEPDGAIARVNHAQDGVLRGLLDGRTIDRLIEIQALARDTSQVYRASAMLGDVRHAIWTELGEMRVAIDPVRRNLQDAYIAQVDALLHPKPSPFQGMPLPPDLRWVLDPMSPDAASLLRQELVDLDAAIRVAVPHAADRDVAAHLTAARYRIARVLYPEREAGAG
jgi:hypothetical protein